MQDSLDRASAPRRHVAIGLSGACLLLALVALLLAGWSAWRTARVARAADSINSHSAQAAARVAALENAHATMIEQQRIRDGHLAAIDSDIRSVRDSLQGLDQRTRNLETAIGALSNQQAGGHDALLLNDAEFLLRAGQQRARLFHDWRGALQAYTLAGQAIAQVQDPAFQPVRASIDNERAALAAAAPPSRQHALEVLNALRAQLPDLPLAAPEMSAVAAGRGMWPRLRHAFSGILRIERDESAPLAAADARFARDLAALDLAQAQAALLDFDDTAYRAALQRVDVTLAAHFDPESAGVRDARANVRALLKEQPLHAAPQLGGALAQLLDLRATHALQAIGSPPSATSGPAPASSGGTRPRP